MNFNQRLLESISYSIVSPFDLYSSNESERNLTPASAGKLVSDELINTSHEAALICVFNAASYNQLSVVLSDVLSVFNIRKLQVVKDACDYMNKFEAVKRLNNSSIASSIFKNIPLHSLNVSNDSYHDVIAMNEVDEDLSVNLDAELTELENIKNFLTNQSNDNILSVKEKLITKSNKLLVIGSVEDMAVKLIEHTEGLPQNTPFTVAICFAGTAEAVNYINAMVLG
jgi:hypothetical protein